MKTKYLHILLGLLAVAGCQESTVQDRREKTGGKNAASSEALPAQADLRFKLSWSEQAQPVTIYHVFYNQNKASNQGGVEIDSINAKEHDLSQPELMIDKTNMAKFPAKGGSICFYIVAENEGFFSDPSEASCLKL